ncbi:MAG: CHAD domain-containing protein [Armatimonadetes bacterium]|nr:CHAD domain-containing protein [Armatimonadota bacterium]
MPKAWTVNSLVPDQALSQAAAAILAVKLPEVLSYEEPARKGDIDGIHDMRVAAKRLREAARVLKPALPAEARKRLLKEVERLNDSLGLVRDRDVIGESFAAIRKRDPRTTPLDGLCTHLAEERRRYHKDLLAFLDDLHASGFAEFYARTMDDMVALSPEGQPTIMAFAREAIEARLTDTEQNWETASRPWNVSEFHRQRIRVKKLKYAIEPFSTLLPQELLPIYDQIADLQELMGLVHDCDVQHEVLEQWVAAHGPAPVYSVAEEHIASRRQRALSQLAALLEEMVAADWAGRLRALLEGSRVAVPA